MTNGGIILSCPLKSNAKIEGPVEVRLVRILDSQDPSSRPDHEMLFSYKVLRKKRGIYKKKYKIKKEL